MSARATLKQHLERAASLSKSGNTEGARKILDSLREDLANAELGHETALGIPRKLQSAYLKLAKAEKDAVARVGYQYHLVPPPATLQRFAKFSSAERRAVALANRQPVPRVLHQIWIGDAPLPIGTTHWRRHAEHHGYQYRLWREDDLEQFNIRKSAVYQAMLERGDYPGAVDVARYLILQKFGGIYLDCDWYPARIDLNLHDLTPMLGLTALAESIPRNTGKGALLLANSMLATPPGHPVFDRLVAILDDVMQTLPDAPAWWITGPLIFTLVSRGGSITLADATLVAGSLPQDTPQIEVDAWCQENQQKDGGLLLAWKSWVW